ISCASGADDPQWGTQSYTTLRLMTGSKGGGRWPATTMHSKCQGRAGVGPLSLAPAEFDCKLAQSRPESPQQTWPPAPIRWIPAKQQFDKVRERCYVQSEGLPRLTPLVYFAC